MATRVTSARFVGRTEELEELASAAREAAASHSSLAFVAGESGGGKSRLVGELASRARRDGWRVLSGDCVELGEGELPYAPLIAALRPLVRAEDPALEALPATQRADLATIVPGLGTGAGDAAVEQVRVFEALLALLDRLGADDPVLLVVEDVHWADSSTRGFLSFLSRNVCDERLLVVATYRSDELHRRHPLRPLLAELARDPAAHVVELPLLSQSEMGEQLADILGKAPDPGLIERLYARSEGNPLFTEELLAAGLDGRGSLPPTLRDALVLRVERLSEPAQALLRWLSLQPADDALLAELAGLEPAVLHDALREAASSHITISAPDGSYAFRHALLREVVYDDLLPGERAELHATLARALEDRVAREGERAHLTAQVAHHWVAAGDQPAALAASVRAAAAAERVNAFGEALALLERVLALWPRVPEPQRLAGADQLELLARAAEMADVAGDSVRQEALLDRALDLVDEQAEPRRAARLLERLARAQGSLNRQDEGLRTIDRALGLLPGDDRSVERAALLAAGARARMLQARYADAAERARAALQAARDLGDPRIEVRALNSLGVAEAGLGDVDGGVAALRQALARSQDADLEYERNISYDNLADLLLRRGRAEDAMAVASEGLELVAAGTRDAEWLSLAVAEAAFHAGRWDEADAAMPTEGRRRSGQMLAYWRVVHSALALGRGDLDVASADLEAISDAMQESTEVQFVATWGALLAELGRRRGALAEAGAVVDETLDRIEFCSEDMARIAEVAETGVRVEADAAQDARDRGDDEAEETARGRSAALLERVELAAQAAGPVERAALASAAAEHRRSAGASDPAAWEAAAEAWLAVGRPYPALCARLRQAEALVGAGDRAGAASVAAAALGQARELGSDWLAAELESLAARARLRIDDGPAPQPAAGAGREQPFGLTARELQVLALVAAGATNRQIGSDLHMAEKTASVHVSRILAKLDVRSRTEAAAVAHRQGLAGDPAVSR